MHPILNQFLSLAQATLPSGDPLTHQGVINQFALGLNVMACVAIGLFFLRFWRKTRDRLFSIFALAFLLLGLNWLLLALIQSDERRPLLYLIRLLAFVLIIYAIVDKNRARPANSV